MPAGPRFVIQKHDARRLHYDLRLEIDGVLASWAVPKGPSTDPSVKRLAVPTSDHELGYAGYEGLTGTYGSGAVIVWDTGTYRNLTHRAGSPVPAADAVERGHLKFWLDGHKLTGGWALTRTDPARWLLVKVRDAEADAGRDPTRSEPASVLTGRTIEDVIAGR